MVNCLVGFCFTYLFYAKYGTINGIDKNASTTITTAVCTATRKFPETTDRYAKTNCKTAGHFEKNIVEARRMGEKGLNTFSAEGIANSQSEFIYKPEEGITIPAYFKKYETIFAKRCQLWSDK